MRYLTIPHCSSDVPKVRIHDVILNIESKTGTEEVPPRRNEYIQNLSANTETNNIIRGFEEDIYELAQTLYKCNSIFASDFDQN